MSMLCQCYVNDIDNSVIINDNDNHKRYARSLIRFKRS